MNPCLFCNLYKDPHSLVGGIVYEDAFVYAYHYAQGEGLNYLGHLLLVTKRHVPGLAELNDAEGQAVGLSLARLSTALKASTGADKVYAEAYYEVNPHLHVHLVARYPATPPAYWRSKIGDWPDAPKGGQEAITALCERLKTQLASGLPMNASEREQNGERLA